MANRLTLFASLVVYGVLIAASVSSPALAAKHKHHNAGDRSKHIAKASTSPHEHRNHRTEEVDVTVKHEEQRAKHVRGAAPVHLSRSERKRMLKMQHIAAIDKRRIHLAAVAERDHLLYLAAHPTKQQLAARAAALHEHQKQIMENRRERIAEMNGDLSSHSIRAWQSYIDKVPVRLISVDLNDPGVKVSALLARNGIGSAEPFSRMIRRSQPDVAVTGTFFSLDNLRPVGDIVINGGLAYFGGMGTALCITRDNQAQMITVPWGHHHDWSPYDFVMACGPRLLQDHVVVLDPKSERFHDRHMLSPNSRIGVGITATNKLVFVMTKKPIYLGTLAKVMQEIGCSQAMNLDAGTSTGFYYEGNMMASPGRWLTNAIVVYANQHHSDQSST